MFYEDGVCDPRDFRLVAHDENDDPLVTVTCFDSEIYDYFLENVKTMPRVVKINHYNIFGKLTKTTEIIRGQLE